MGVQAEIEFVADPTTPEPETKWYIEEFGGGVMVWEREPKKFGRVFLTQTSDDEDLLLIEPADQR